MFQVSELGGVPILISPGDMSNTIPDEKVTATFIGYLAARLLDLSRYFFVTILESQINFLLQGDKGC